MARYSTETQRRQALARFDQAVDDFQTHYAAMIAASYSISAALSDLRRLNDVTQDEPATEPEPALT